MENLEIILSCAATALGLLITTITFIMKFVKSNNAKNVLSDLLKKDVLLDFMSEAETFIGLSGPEKKEYVMSKAEEFTQKNGIEFDVDAVSEKIEDLIRLTKQINPRKKDI